MHAPHAPRAPHAPHAPHARVDKTFLSLSLTEASRPDPPRPDPILHAWPDRVFNYTGNQRMQQSCELPTSGSGPFCLPSCPGFRRSALAESCKFISPVRIRNLWFKLSSRHDKMSQVYSKTSLHNIVQIRLITG